jgi:hypothetical protein
MTMTQPPSDCGVPASRWHPPGGHHALRLRSRQEFADAWDDLRAVKLDIGHEGLMREASHAVFKSKRVAPRAARFAAIFCATVSGDPT